MSVSDFRHLYLLGIACMVMGITMGALLLIVPEIIAAWVNKQPGDTITEIMRSLNLPGFIYVTGAAASLALGVFGASLMLHFWHKWGL